MSGDWNLREPVQTHAGNVLSGSCGQGLDVVLVHGWPWSSYTWSSLIPHLAKSYRVHWYDMPGYGRSDKHPKQRTSLDVQGRVLCEMLDHWRLDAPAIVAHDIGGATALRAHLLHNADFSHLILMNPVALSPWGSDFFDHVGRHVDAFAGLPPHIHRAIVTAYIKGALVHDLNKEIVENLVAPWLDDAGAASFYRQFAQADETYTREIEPYFADVRCPTALIWGQDDPWIPVERGRMLKACLAPRTFVELPGVGHLPQLEAPQVVAGISGGFLAKQADQAI